MSFRLAILTAVFAFAALSQEIRGTVNGTVRDESATIVPGAAVEITDSVRNELTPKLATLADQWLNREEKAVIDKGKAIDAESEVAEQPL